MLQDGDFSLVERMLGDNPQFRGENRIEIG
jgi:hypothetical protein